MLIYSRSALRASAHGDFAVRKSDRRPKNVRFLSRHRVFEISYRQRQR